MRGSQAGRGSLGETETHAVRHALFWAKTGADDGSWRYKPVAHHGLDVAACVEAYLRHNPARLSREVRLSGLSGAAHVATCAFLAALHDLGKFSKSFQALAPEVWPVAALGPVPAALPGRVYHWQASAVLLNAGPVHRALAPVFGPFGPDRQVIAAVAGHHGVAPDMDHLDRCDAQQAERDPLIGKACVAAAVAFCEDLVRLFPDLRDIGDPHDTAGFSFSLNGLVTLADWVGSDVACFPFKDPDLPLAEYWPLARQRAETALADKGLLPARVVSSPVLARFSAHTLAPRPMQARARDLPLPLEPQIIVIEDGTGSGKTEATLLLAARMMAAGLGEGLFIALPTMATANAMHTRLETALAGLFEGPASLVLAHGKAGLAARLDRLAAGDGPDARDSAVRTWFNAWIADNRKKAFFASAGAGTIDQAFLSILRRKHLTMRQYALAGRVLVVDEAHACDAYMGEELEVLVEMHARLGGSVIVLSATLGHRARAGLVAAFAHGRGVHPNDLPDLRRRVCSPAYPLLTHWSATRDVEECPVESDPALARRIAIRRVESREQVVRLALAAAGQGACIAIICNAVDPAVEMWHALVEAGQDRERCHLFHARFTVADRGAIEARVLRLFGRDSDPATRSGRILVATQVVEQSLDVDFDAIFSDLAPVDMVIQRAGRLWRHHREARPVAAPVLHLLAPDPHGIGDARWLEPVLGAGAFVYKVPGVMWRGARDLFAKGALETPGDLRSLVETAYDPGTGDLPACLHDAHHESLGREYGEKSMAGRNAIRPDDGYAALAELSADEDIGTRLGEPSLTFRLARREGGVLVPLCQTPGAEDSLDWSLSEMSVREGWLRRAGGGSLPGPLDPVAVESVRANWPEWEQAMPLYEVDAEGHLLTAGAECLRYDASYGLGCGAVE